MEQDDALIVKAKQLTHERLREDGAYLPHARIPTTRLDQPAAEAWTTGLQRTIRASLPASLGYA